MQGNPTTTRTASQKSDWWRAVLGEFPTGVCLVAARNHDDDPVGMVVGSFVAISEDPPLIGFFAGNGSRTLPSLLADGRLTISVLSAGHEEFCRSFASGSPDRWASGHYEVSATGRLRVRDAVAWFETTVEQAEQHGDHTFVVARVTDFGTGAPGGEAPLLFRRAGYGTFAAPHEEYDARALIQRLHWADLAEREISPLASRFGVELTVNTQIGDAVVTLATATDDDHSDSSERVGASHPWAAPISPVFAAWASPAKQHAWEEASRHLIGVVDRDLIERQLNGVRERGFAVAGDAELTRRFLDLVHAPSPSRTAYVEMWQQISRSRRSLEQADGVVWENVAVVQVPVHDPTTGDVLLGLYAISDKSSRLGGLEAVADELVVCADRISATIGRERRAVSDAG